MVSYEALGAYMLAPPVLIFIMDSLSSIYKIPKLYFYASVLTKGPVSQATLRCKRNSFPVCSIRQKKSKDLGKCLEHLNKCFPQKKFIFLRYFLLVVVFTCGYLGLFMMNTYNSYVL